MATGLNYPVVPKGDEEIRFQISAEHTKDDIDYVLKVLKKYKNKTEIYEKLESKCDIQMTFDQLTKKVEKMILAVEKSQPATKSAKKSPAKKMPVKKAKNEIELNAIFVYFKLFSRSIN